MCGRSISQVRLRTIYYQQVVDQSKVQHADKRTGTGVSPCRRHLSRCAVLYVKVIDPKTLKHEQYHHHISRGELRVEPLWDCPVCVLSVRV